MTDTWVLVANASRARLLVAETPVGGLSEVEDFIHTQTRLHDRDLISDRPGRAFDSAGEGRHAMEQKTDPKKQEAINFAKQLGEHLETARHKGEFGKLVLVAAPAFLGLLRENLHPNTLKSVTVEIDKDWVALNPSQLRGQLPDRL